MTQYSVRLGARIREARKAAGMTQQQLAEHIGVIRETLAAYETGRYTVSLETLHSIAAATRQKVAWFLDEEADDVARLRALSDAVERRLPKDSRSLMVPLLGRVAGGKFSDAIEQVEDVVSVPSHWASGKAPSFLLRVHGDSMAPDIQEDDLVAVRMQPQAESGQIVVATVLPHGEATVKRFRKRKDGAYLEAENPAYESTRMSENHRIVGVVVGLLRDYLPRRR